MTQMVMLMFVFYIANVVNIYNNNINNIGKYKLPICYCNIICSSCISLDKNFVQNRSTLMLLGSNTAFITKQCKIITVRTRQLETIKLENV